MNEKYYQNIVYIVQYGDTLSEIAVKYNTTMESIINKNKLETTDIFVNQKLVIDAYLTNKEKSKLYKKQEQQEKKIIKKQNTTTNNNPIKTNIDIKEIEKKYGKYKGIDVAKYQGKINWKTVKKEGIDFAIIKMFDSILIL